jgi:hypothetical protein
MTFWIAKSMGQSYNPEFIYAASCRKLPDTIRETGSGPRVSCAGITPAEETSVVARLGMRYRRGTNA